MKLAVRALARLMAGTGTRMLIDPAVFAASSIALALALLIATVNATVIMKDPAGDAPDPVLVPAQGPLIEARDAPQREAEGKRGVQVMGGDHCCCCCCCF